MNNKLLAVIIGSLVILSSGIIFLNYNQNNKFIDKEIKESEENTQESLENFTSFDQAVNAFTFDIYDELSKNNIENLFFSPYSIFTALSMVYEGARNNTAAELKNVLHVDQDNESFHNYMKSLYDYLNENSEYNISTANALWPREGYLLLEEYTDIINNFYGGGSNPIDYTNPALASEIINNWVENHTNNLIQDLVPESAIDPILTMLILTNAIYFKGDWKVQFDEENTSQEDFTTIDNNVLSVDTMKLVDTEERFYFTKIDELKILELPYDGDEISMYIFLPREGYDITDIPNFVDNSKLYSFLDLMEKKEVDIYLPKFNFTKDYRLNDYLTALGMQDSFSGDADFSGIDGSKSLFISDIIHKAFIDVNEKGTEAAAATAIVMKATSVQEPEEPIREEFRCDHPFMFLLLHKETNTILFMGNVMEPIIED